MDYKEKYEQALAKAKEQYNYPCMRSCMGILEEIFPELKESEAEKIRKALLEMVHDTTGDELLVDYGVHKEEALDWLERQGEQIDIANKEYWRGYREGKKLILDKYAEIEKPGKQIAGYTTIVETGDGGINSLVVRDIEIPFGAKDSELQEFTYFIPQGYYAKIEDDKVVIKKGEQKPNPYTGTSFEYNGHIWGMCARDNGVEILFDGELKAFLSLERSFIYPIHPQPELAPKSAMEAIKEEKVDNANKVEPKSYDSIDPQFFKPADSYCQENCKGFQETGKCFADGECNAKRKAEQKPKENKGNVGGISANWSEEDEENFCSVYLDVKSARQNTVNSLSGELKEQEQKRMDEVISWLKSIKGRVKPQPKQEWSEDDKKIINGLIDSLTRISINTRTDSTSPNFSFYKEIDWLKSLRPQNKWKPSDEQVKAFEHFVRSIGESGYASPYENNTKLLYSLLEQLKKLL